MSNRTTQHKKAGTSSLMNPSLTSPSTPTLASPTRGFGIQPATLKTETQVSSDFQQQQSDSEKLIEEEAFKQPLHDISRISMRPQARLWDNPPADPNEDKGDWVTQRLMQMAAPEPLEGFDVPIAQKTVQRKCAACEKEEEEKLQAVPLLQRAELDNGFEVDGNELSDVVHEGGAVERKFLQSSVEHKESDSLVQAFGLEDREEVVSNKERAANTQIPEFSKSVETAAEQEQSPAVVETGSTAKMEDGGANPTADAVEAIGVPEENIQLPTQGTAKAEGDKNKGEDSAKIDGDVKGEVSEKLPESQVEKAVAKDEAADLNSQGMAEAASREIAVDKGENTKTEGLEKLPEESPAQEAPKLEEVANLNSEGMANAVSPETVAEKEQATTAATEVQAQQNVINAETTQLASTGINFLPPMQEETDEGENNAAFSEQQTAEASSIASSFLAEAALRVQTITQLGQGIGARIQGSVENAKASVMAAVEQQKATITAQIAQQRDQAQSEGHAILAQIQAQYQAAVAATSQTTATERQKVETEYTTSLQKVDESENNQLARIEEFYTQAKEKYRAAGVKVGDEASAFGEQKASAWESQITGKDDNFWDGPLSDNRLKARAKAAREVAKQYKDGLIQEANKQADAVDQGKPKDIEAIRNIANQSREQLQTLQKQSLDNLNAVEQQVMSQLGEAQTQLTQTANQTLQGTLQSLNQQEVAQLQFLEGYGQRQISAIERDAQKAIASIQDGINQAAANLQGVLQDTQAQLQGMEAPNPEELSITLAEILAQFDTSVAKVQEQTEQGIVASEQGIFAGGQQAGAGITTLAQSSLEESAAVAQETKTTLTNLNQGATDTFNQIQQAFTTTVTKTTETAVTGFGQTAQGSQTAFDRVNQNLDTNLQKSISELEQGLRGALHGSKEPNLESDIKKYAQEAADQEQPRWKTVVKVLLVVAIIVVAIVVAPAVIGAVGAVAGALGASAAAAGAIGTIVGGAIVGAVAGAVIQMGNNLIDGKNLLDGVGKAALAGAIGGALGGAGGLLGNALAQAGRLGAGLTQTVLKFGIDVAFDIAGGITGDLAVGNPITVEGILIGAGIGAAVQISTANLGKLGKFGRSVEGMQTRTFQAGEQFGTSLGNRIKTGFGGGVNSPTVGRPNVDMPGVKAPETEMPRGDRPEVDTPNGTKPDMNMPGVKQPEIEVKAPETTTPTGRSTHVDEPEIEPGVVAKTPTADGHEIKVLRDGRVVRCSDCGEIRQKYKEILDSRPDLKAELDSIEAMPNSGDKVIKASEFAETLQRISGKRKYEPDATESELTELPPSATENLESQSKRPRREAANRALENIETSGNALAKQRGYSDAPPGYYWTKQNGEPVLSRNPNQAAQLLELRPDPKNPQEFIPVKSPPKDYEWVSQGNGQFTLKAQSDNLPLIEYDPRQEAFINKNTNQIYVPPSVKGSWADHKWGDPSIAPCFPPGTVVKTPEGDRKIEDLVVGDMVIAYDFVSNACVIQPILQLYKNWTQNLVDINVNGELITATRMHPFWVESSNEWVPASELKSGMSLQTPAGNSVTVEFAKIYATESTTYNLNVSQTHNYYVGQQGVLVHNGGEDEKSSNFADPTKKAAKIYEIVDTSSGDEVIVYRGKTIQKSVDDRFKQHLADEAAKKSNWQQKYKEGELSIREIAGGNWTDYETAVWEKHYIDEGLKAGYPLVNDLKAHPISEQKYKEYKHLHNPCP
jgi:hypothetical protein